MWKETNEMPGWENDECVEKTERGRWVGLL